MLGDQAVFCFGKGNLACWPRDFVWKKHWAGHFILCTECNGLYSQAHVDSIALRAWGSLTVRATPILYYYVIVCGDSTSLHLTEDRSRLIMKVSGEELGIGSSFLCLP